MIQTKQLRYQANGCSMLGYLAYDDKFKDQRPAVMVIHDWSGRNDFACKKAEKLAEMGYVGFAVDMYGDAKTAENNEAKSALMAPLKENRKLIQERLLSALSVLKQEELVANSYIATIGFCFGGLCALDLARTGEYFSGAVSFHGLLDAPKDNPVQKIKAKVLVLHGYEDPLAPMAQVEKFAQEMTQANADWQIHLYGNTKHAFTNPKAHDQNLGLIYDAKAEQRSWLAAKNFFDEIF